MTCLACLAHLLFPTYLTSCTCMSCPTFAYKRSVYVTINTIQIYIFISLSRAKRGHSASHIGNPTYLTKNSYTDPCVSQPPMYYTYTHSSIQLNNKWWHKKQEVRDNSFSQETFFYRCDICWYQTLRKGHKYKPTLKIRKKAHWKKN